MSCDRSIEAERREDGTGDAHHIQAGATFAMATRAAGSTARRAWTFLSSALVQNQALAIDTGEGDKENEEEESLCGG